MNTTVTKLPNCLASVQVEVPAEAHAEAYNTIVKGYAAQASIPGFRKGKVPRSVIEKRFAADIAKELRERLVDQAIREAHSKHGINVLGLHKFDGENNLAFTLEVVTTPEFELPDYKGLAITVPKIEASDEAVNELLHQQQERMADFKDVERSVQNGDFLSISYTSTFDGKPLKEQLPESQAFLAENDDYMIKCDEATFLPGFCAQLHGMNANDARDVTVTMPAEAINTLIAGKEVTYHVTVKSIKEPVLPALDDAFAASLTGGKTMEELRAILRQNVENQAVTRDLEQKRIAAMLALREKVDFDLPAHVVQNATQTRINQLVKMNIERGIDRDQIQENEADIIKAANDQAKVDVKDEFILLRVMEAEKLEVSQQDLFQRVQQIAMQSRTPIDKVIKTLQKNDRFGEIRHALLLGKALDVLVEHAAVTYDGTKSPLAPSAAE